ncbi:MAG: transglutaminase-like domain-containing protein [Planctomycetaceae bacterium]
MRQSTRRLFLTFAALVFTAATAASQDLPVIRPGATGPQATPATPDAAATTKAEETDAAAADEHWQVILIGDERIGYVRTRTEELAPAKGRPQRLRTATETKMTFKRFGQSLSIGVDLVTTETPDGQLLSYEYEMGTSPTSTTKSVGTVDGDKLRIETTIAGTSQSKTIPWDATVKSPAYQERVLREEGIKPGETKTFRAFIPEFNQVSEVRIAAHEVREVELPGGERRSLLKTEVTQSVLPTMPMTAWLDDEGELVLVETDMLGQTMRFFDVPKADALREIAGAELDIAVNTLIPATPLDNPHETEQVVYRIHVPGEDAASLFVDGGTQRVMRIDHETVEITVTAVPISKRWGRVQADAEFTEPTALLQSNDATIREHVGKAVSPDRAEGDAALQLERYVHEKLDKKNFTTAFASAAEVADKLEGDCSEHAVLLAALLRARGIPSRVAVGLVYVPGQAKMGGHMWTEALFEDGWVPLDATLGRGGIGGGHLKVADSSLADDAPLPVTAFAPLLSLSPETKIEVLKIER